MNQTADEVLQAYLAQRWGDPGLTVSDFRELSTGWSHITYALTVSRGQEPQRLPIIMQVERPNGVVAGSSVAKDFAILKVLASAPVPVPEPYCLETNGMHLGAPFIVVSRLEGTCFDMFSSADRTTLAAHWEKQTPLPASVVATLAAIHEIPLEHVSFLPAAPSASGTAAYEIERCRQLAEEIGMIGNPYVALALRWLERHQPEDGWLTLIHGDYYIRNLLFAGDRVAGVLDWESSRVSNPIFDLAYMCIPYMAGKFFAPGSPLASGLAPVDWLVQEYGRRTGRTVSADAFCFWRVLATLSLLLIIETGISAHAAGRAPEMRFAWLRFVTPVLREDMLALLNV